MQEKGPGEEAGELRTVDLPSVAPSSFDGDVRQLKPVSTDLAMRAMDFESKLEEVETPIGVPEKLARIQAPMITAAPAPAPNMSFAGLSRLDAVTGGQAGAGFPPDTNGDVGLNHYILSVNDAYAIYDKSTGTLLSAFTENSRSQGSNRNVVRHKQLW